MSCASAKGRRIDNKWREEQRGCRAETAGTGAGGRCIESGKGRRERTPRDGDAVRLLPLVRRLALQVHRRLPRHFELDDLVGAGVLGLVEAVRRYDARRQVDVKAYAAHRIRGAMLDSLRAWDPVSRDTRRKMRRTEEAAAELEARLGRAPSDLELAGALGLSLKRWRRTVRDFRCMGYEAGQPEQAWGVGEPLDEATLADGRAADPWALCYRGEQRELLRRAMSGLAERERAMLRLYYQRGWTMKRIGARLGIHESRVSQLHAATLERLRSAVQTMLRVPRTGDPLSPSALASERV